MSRLRVPAAGQALAATLTIASVAAPQSPPVVPFRDAEAIPLDFLPTPVAANADLNRDGVADLVAGNALFAISSGTVSGFLLDEGGRELAELGVPRNTLLPTTVNITTGDFDSDGFTDVLTVGLNGQVQLYTNAGPPFLRDGVSFSAVTPVFDLATIYRPNPLEGFVIPVFFTADVDGDSFLDLVVAGKLVDALFWSERPTDLLVLHGDGGGKFGAPATVPTMRAPMAGCIADFDGDGTDETIALLTDVAMGGGYAESVELFAASGRGLSAELSIRTLPFSGRATALEVRDLDGDGVPDFAIAGFDGYQQQQQGRLYSIIGQRDGSFAAGYARHYLPSASGNPNEITSVRARDFDGDGVVDLLALQSFDQLAPARLVLFPGQGNGAFGAPVTKDLAQWSALVNSRIPSYAAYGLRSTPDALAVLDLNGDQSPDLAIAGLRETSNPYTPVLATMINTNAAGRQGGIRHIGNGCPASTGTAARIGTNGVPPALGRRNFAITLTDTAGDGMVATFYAGPVQYRYVYNGLVLYTLPMVVSIPYMTRGAGIDGGYVLDARVGIPDDRSLIGVSAYFQWAVVVPGAGPFPVFTSDALEVTLDVQY